MAIRLWAALHLDVDVARLRVQGVQCPYSTGNVVVLSAMRDGVDDILLERAKFPVQQTTVLVPAGSWDRSNIELPPHLKKLRAGKLDRVVMVFESPDYAAQLARWDRSFAWSSRGP